MIGIFDSGVGGIFAYNLVRKAMPLEDIIYLADRKNAPYGTKTEDEILKFTKKNIQTLRNMGAKAILIACCSASTVYQRLNEEEKAIAIPIITPTARVAAQVSKRIAVIATRHTARSGAFGREIAKFSSCTVVELAEQPLVTLVEEGNRDGKISGGCGCYLKEMAERIRATEADTLILGCTHFSHLEGEISKLIPEVKIISPARVGAEELIKKINNHRENGKIIYM